MNKADHSKGDDVRVVRATPGDLERVLDSMTRTSDRTKEWVRAHFVDGKTPSEIAREHGVEPQHVGNKIRTVHAKLVEQASPQTYVMMQIAMPISLGQELQGLANEIGERGSHEIAETTWQPVLRAAAAARKRLAEE